MQLSPMPAHSHSTCNHRGVLPQRTHSRRPTACCHTKLAHRDRAPTPSRVLLHCSSRVLPSRQCWRQHKRLRGVVVAAAEGGSAPNAAQIIANLQASPVSGAASSLMAGMSSDLLPGQVIGGKYTVGEVLGKGATAVTYKAVSPDGTEVAVKAVSLRNLKDWKLLEMFQREAQTLKNLNHPNIPRYLDYFEEDTASDKRFYLVQELAKGKSLEEIVLGGARATEQEVLRVAEQVLSVLSYLGDLRPPVVHRDVKPENIVLENGTWGGRVFLVDFGGVQRAALAGDSLGSTVIGTYGYMAPEQFRGAAQPASDVYALGATLLFLLSGVTPSNFPTERMRISWEGQVTAGPLLTELLRGLLEPLAEDRLTAKEAIALIKGEKPPAYALAEKKKSALTLRKPAGTRVQINKSGNTFDMEIPPAGLTGNTVMTGAFAVAWNAFVAFWTVSALAGGGILFALFSAPFWVAGVQLAKQTIGGSLTRQALQIGRNRYRFLQELAIFRDGEAKFLGTEENSKAVEGSTQDLTGARVITVAIVNGEPQNAIELVEGANVYRFGEGLQPAEQEWIVQEINSHLQQLAGKEVDTSSMPTPIKPKVYADSDDEDDKKW